jgi:hypothetical protein
LEYSTTKNEIYTQWGNATPGNGYYKNFWEKIFKKYNNKSIYLVSKNHLKKLREEYSDDLVTLDEYIQTEEFRDNIKAIHDSYLFIPFSGNNGDAALNSVRNLVRFLINEFYKPIADFQLSPNHPLKNEKELLADVSHLIIRSLPSNIREAVDYLTSLSPSGLFSANRRNVYYLEREILGRLISEPQSSSGSLDYQIFSRIPEWEERETTYKTLAKLGDAVFNRRGVNYNDSFFMVKDFARDVSNLLLDSNMLNLPIEEKNEQVNLLMVSWLQRWNNKINIIEKEYHELSEKS